MASSGQTPPFDAQAFAVRINAAANDKERADLYVTLSNTQKKRVNAEIKKIMDAQAAENPPPEDDESEAEDLYSAPVITPATTVIPPVNSDSIVITDDEIKDMWTVIDRFDVTVISAEDLKVFEYEGFNPDEILRAMMKQKAINSISNQDFMSHIAILCGLAIIKGTVNDNNFKKMKKAGQEVFLKLQTIYGIKMGSSKGQSAEVVTVSRIAASFPGTVIKLLHNKIVSAREFSGIMKSSKMNPAIRHQALAACIPSDLDSDVKEFFFSAIAGFATDQSLTITKPKPDPVKALEDQMNFVRVAHGGRYPTEAVRLAIFKGYNWRDMYSGMADCVREVAKKDDSRIVIDLPTFNAAITKLGG